MAAECTSRPFWILEAMAHRNGWKHAWAAVMPWRSASRRLGFSIMREVMGVWPSLSCELNARSSQDNLFHYTVWLQGKPVSFADSIGDHEILVGNAYIASGQDSPGGLDQIGRIFGIEKSGSLTRNWEIWQYETLDSESKLHWFHTGLHGPFHSLGSPKRCRKSMARRGV